MRERIKTATFGLALAAPFVVGVFLGALAGPSDVHADTIPTKPGASAQQTRDCAWTSGTEVDCSAAVAYSAQLTANARYAVQAISGKVYFRQTTAARYGSVKAADLYLPTGAWLTISTVNGRRYLSCDGTDDTATLRYMECQ